MPSLPVTHSGVCVPVGPVRVQLLELCNSCCYIGRLQIFGFSWQVGDLLKISSFLSVEDDKSCCLDQIFQLMQLPL